MNRRDFLKAGGCAAAWLALRREAYAAFSQSPALQLYKATLRGLELPTGNTYPNGGIPVAVPDDTSVAGAVHYTIAVGQYTDQLHPDLPATTLWGYAPVLSGQAPVWRHLGGVIAVDKGTIVQMTVQNRLSVGGVANGTPLPHILPVDSTQFTADYGTANNRVAVHLHGGLIPWISDGGPYDWFGTGGALSGHGPSFKNNDPAIQYPYPKVGGWAVNEAEYYYPNDQSARLMWYHDHAHGNTRLNAYAGIATGYVIRDNAEKAMVATCNLPAFAEAGGREIPLILQDKIFKSQTTLTGLYGKYEYPKGGLWYPYVYDRSRWTWDTTKKVPRIPSVVAESFGDTMLVNGKVCPSATVKPRRYRFRLLNACNARFVNLQLYEKDGSADGITLDAYGNPINYQPVAGGPVHPAPAFDIIGAEGGFLPAFTSISNSPPKPMNVALDPNTGQIIYGPVGTATEFRHNLLVGSAERFDFIIDFNGFGGKTFVLYNDAPAPFPGGDPLNDYRGGNGMTPNTRILMQFVVEADPNDPDVLPPDLPLNTTQMLSLINTGNPSANPPIEPIDPFFVTPGQTVNGSGMTVLPSGPVTTRIITLNEQVDEYGRLAQLVGTGQKFGRQFGRPLESAATEVTNAGDVEVWKITNLTGDTHPMHFHLVNVQILSRQLFNILGYTGGNPLLIGNAWMPEPDERGWKEVVRCNPGEVTTIAMKIIMPRMPDGMPFSTRVVDANNVPIEGHEYVYHCHILEHEEHDMMRPFLVRK